MKYDHPAQIPISKTLRFEWTANRIPLADMSAAGDTYPQTWADDDHIYLGAGDPSWFERNGVRGYRIPGIPEEEAHAATSGQVFEKLTGDPHDFGLDRVHDMPGYIGSGGDGPKPCGLICVDGIMYYAVQNLLGRKTPPHRVNSQHGSDATIICTKDHGITWEPELNDFLKSFRRDNWDPDKGIWKTTEDERREYKNWSPMFPGPEFGGLSFVQFGKDNAGAVDEYVYAVSGDQWDNGRCIRLGRVHKNKIMDRGAWEFSVIDNNEPAWTPELSNATPILDIEGHLSIPEMVYIAPLKKYLLLTWGLHTDFYTPTGSELTILEADDPWGPFSLLHYEWIWDERILCAYNPRIPLKWFDPANLEGYLLHSGNWGYMQPDGNWHSYHHLYRPTLRKFRITFRDDPMAEFLY